MTKVPEAIERFQRQIHPAGKTPETKLFQAWINAEILDQVIEQRNKDKISWRDLIEHCFELYLDLRRDQPAIKKKQIRMDSDDGGSDE